MGLPNELPHLIALADDDSSAVRAEVIDAFKALGDRLEPLLMTYSEAWEGPRKPHVRAICREVRKVRFEEAWPQWLEIGDEFEALEEAMKWLSFLTASFGSPMMPVLLDQWTDRFQAVSPAGQLPALMRFLFLSESLGPPHGGFHDPIHSNIVEVLRRKEGLQISLSIIAILIGKRVGIEIYGFNWPRHFMMFVPQGEEYSLLDPFNQGKPLPARALTDLSRQLKTKGQEVSSFRAQTPEMVVRVLRNMIHAFHNSRHKDQAAYYEKLLSDLVRRLGREPLP